MPQEHFEIAARYCGPPRSGNGGYACGRIARHLRGAAAVRLRVPPPLNTPLRLESAADEARLFHGEALVGEARRRELELAVPPCPTFDQALESAQTFAGFRTHAFPGCFVCGTARAPRDGLRIFPGALTDGSTLAAPWIPDDTLADATGTVRSEFVWSALDCTGGFAVLPVPAGLAIVLGELHASIEGTVAHGQRCIALGWRLGAEGRKLYAGSAVCTEEGRLIGRARAVWLTVPAGAWD